MKPVQSRPGQAGLGALPGLLAVLNAVGPISTDMYLPAFPAMRADLHGSPSAAPLTLAAWFGGIAVGQLVYGPLSDRVGRRSPMLLGCALYILASAACALSTGMAELIAFRALAAFGGAASLVVPRAIIRDIAISGDQAASIVSRQQLILSVVPMLAPTLGGVIVDLAGWRTIFWVAAFYGVLCLVLIAKPLGETLPQSSRTRGGLSTVAAAYFRVGRDRVFVTYALTGSFATFSLFAFLGGAPAIFLRHFGMSPTLFGATFIANGAGYAIGTALNTLLIARYGRSRVLTIAVLALLGGSGVTLLSAITEIGGMWGIEGSIVAVMLTLGCVLPDAAIGAIAPYQRDAGIASALYGTVAFAIGALGAVGAGLLPGPAAVSMSILLLIGAAMAVASNLMRPASASRRPR